MSIKLLYSASFCINGISDQYCLRKVCENHRWNVISNNYMHVGVLTDVFVFPQSVISHNK